MIKFRNNYVTTADRARMDARQAENVDTYGAPFPVIILPFTRAQIMDVFAVIFLVGFLVAVMVAYVSDANAAMDMCREVWNTPTDHIPAACR